jgi:hypothetical protein
MDAFHDRYSSNVAASRQPESMSLYFFVGKYPAKTIGICDGRCLILFTRDFFAGFTAVARV